MEKNNSNIALLMVLAVVIALLGVVAFTFFSFPEPAKQEPAWKQLVDDKNGISVEVKPLKLSHTENSEFSVVFTTHQGSLDFDPAKVSVLQDNTGKKYWPVKWDGSPSGGHHRNGKLIFPKLSDSVMEVKLVIDVLKSDRIFEWSLH